MGSEIIALTEIATPQISNCNIMMKRQSKDHFFYLAPIRGVTDALFRDIYHRHFPGFDASVAPFINPQRFASFKDKYLTDILPEHNTSIPVVPQLLYNNGEDFIKLAQRLEQFGYEHINWNLGCPAPMVANKQRGSGLLPQTDQIVTMLNEILPALTAQVSLKVRLGFKDPSDLERLLPRLEDLELKEIIIHPRIGKQLYRGSADREAFDRCAAITSHTLVYNGDIQTRTDFLQLTQRFPDIERWMIGRGALANPLLVAEIQGETFDPATRIKKISAFHGEFFATLGERLSGPSHLLSKMKQLWAYLILSFPGKEKWLKRIRKASTLEKYQEAVDELFLS